jgi:hypothetical protein
MLVSVAPLPVVMTVSIEGFSLFTTNIKKGARSVTSQTGLGAGNKLAGNSEALESG